MPARDLIEDTFEQLNPTSEEKPKMLCKVFEDDQAACQPVSNQQLSVQAKHFAVKCHFFCWQFVHHVEKNPDEHLVIEKCSTDLVKADCLTGGFAKIKFAAN